MGIPNYNPNKSWTRRVQAATGRFADKSPQQTGIRLPPKSSWSQTKEGDCQHLSEYQGFFHCLSEIATAQIAQLTSGNLRKPSAQLQAWGSAAGERCEFWWPQGRPVNSPDLCPSRMSVHTRPCAGGGVSSGPKSYAFWWPRSGGGGRKIILGGFHHVLCHQTTLLQFICQRWMINIVIITTLAQVEQKVLRFLCVYLYI